MNRLFKIFFSKANLKSSNGDSSGFTLMEVLLALGILCFSVLALYRMQSTAINTGNTAWKFTKAASLAAGQIEYLTSLSWDSPSLVSGSTENPPYELTWEVSETGTMKNIKHIRVTSSWKEKKRTHNYILTSCVGKAAGR